MDRWKWNNYNEVRYINIPDWAEMGVMTAFTARSGGFSQDEFYSLNMGLHVGDDKDRVIRNRELVLKGLNSALANIVCGEQVHGTEVAVINKEDIGKGAYDFSTALKGIDAMVTNVPHLFLATFYADCYPLYLFDPSKRVIGIAHSGWKGTMGRIGAITAQTMRDKFGTDIEDLLIFIGPGIGKCCFEINAELASKVQKEFKQLNNILTEDKKGFFWDLENTNRQVLLQMGIKEDHIITSNLCTSCHINDFYSYRRDKGQTGRMAAIIGLSY